MLEKVKYTTSAGIASNRFLSKIASHMATRPHGQALLLPRAVMDVLNPLPIAKIPQVGHKTGKLISERLNVHKIEGRQTVFLHCTNSNHASHVFI